MVLRFLSILLPDGANLPSKFFSESKIFREVRFFSNVLERSLLRLIQGYTLFDQNVGKSHIVKYYYNCFLF